MGRAWPAAGGGLGGPGKPREPGRPGPDYASSSPASSSGEAPRPWTMLIAPDYGALCLYMAPSLNCQLQQGGAPAYLGSFPNTWPHLAHRGIQQALRRHELALGLCLQD